MPSAEQTYDVAVIGGGPAGSSAATRTAAAGLKTVLLEKEVFPRFHIGESLLPQGNHLLAETGVWPKVAAAGFVDKFGASFWLPDGSLEKEIIFDEGLVEELGHTFQVERSRFDEILLEHARESGAEVRTGTTVRKINSHAEGHRIDLESPAGEQEIQARWIIDAGGRDSLYPSKLKSRLCPSHWPRRIAIYNHFHHVARTPGPAGGHTVIVRLADGWFWLIPISPDRTSVGLVTTVQALRESQSQPADYFTQAVESSPKLHELMADAQPTMAYQVTSDYSYFRQRLAEGRLVLAGDAGGFFDPVFSSGVYVACLTAKLAADTVIRAHRSGRALSPGTCRRYTRTVRRYTRVFRRLINAFYDNDSFSVFMCPRPPVGLQPAITSIVAGCSQLSWPMWWRFQFFLLVCRLQRYLPLVPDLRIGDTPRPSAALPA